MVSLNQAPANTVIDKMKSIAQTRGTKLFLVKENGHANIIFDDIPDLNLQRDCLAWQLRDEVDEPMDAVFVKASPAAYKSEVELFSTTSPMATKNVQGKLRLSKSENKFLGLKSDEHYLEWDTIEVSPRRSKSVRQKARRLRHSIRHKKNRRRLFLDDRELVGGENLS